MTEKHSNVRALPLQGSRPSLGDAVDLRTLIPHAATVVSPIRYGDTVWDFEGYPLVNQTVKFLDFSQVPSRWRHLVKDWVLLRLNPQLAKSGASGLNTDDVMAKAAAAERPLKLPSAFAYALGLSVSLKIIDKNAWARMGPADWSSFALQLAAENPDATAVTLAGYARPLLSLWTYRRLLGMPDMFGGRPFSGATPEQVFKAPDRGLNVNRPAPELCGPLLGLSLWIMDHCAEDVLARLEVLAAVPDHSHLTRSEQVSIVTRRLLEWEETGRPLPAVTSLKNGALSPAWATFVKLSGCSNKDLKNPVGEAQKVLMRFWAGALAYSCAFVIAMLTTVRDRELAALPHDCIIEDLYESGDTDVPVTRMRGYLVKNRLAPTPATWVVGADVVYAVEIIHRLKKALHLPPRPHPETGQDVLLHPGLGRGMGKRTSGDTLQLSHQYLTWFRKSSSHLAQLGFLPSLPVLPDWLSHRTIRITGIEAYASQPWGDALAAAQAHWSSRTIAEGYLGHLPRSVFIADPDSVEEVRQLTTAQILLDVAGDAAHTDTAVAGNGVDRLDSVLHNANAYELVTGPVTKQDLLQVSKKNPHVFVGEFTICVFGPGGLCGNEDEADFKLCRPFICRNSAMTKSQRARLELRRRVWKPFGGVFGRALRKIEEDVPGLAKEFKAWDDAKLREFILSDMPGRYMQAAKGAEEP